MLGHGEIIFIAGLLDFQSVGGPRRIGSANEIGVEARPGADAAGAAASVAQVQRVAVVRVAGNDYDACFRFVPSELQLYVIAIGETEVLCGGGTKHRGVVPG